MKVTLHEVAARARVSIATVSRALNGLAVSPASRERVLKAVAELGYVANESARALRAERTMTLGLIFYDLRNTLGVELVDALGESIEAGGYSLLIASARGDAGRYSVLIRRFLERRIDGLFCINPVGEGADLARYAATGAPVLSLFAAAPAFSDLPLLTPSFTEPGKALAADLTAWGHTRGGLIVDGESKGVFRGVGAALKAAGFHLEKIEANEAGGMSQVIAAWQADPNRPTVLLARDPQAQGLIAAAASAGISVPRDLSIVSISEIALEPRNRKRGVSTITVDPHRMGKAAAAAMLAWLGGTRPAHRIQVQAATWEPRGSSGPAPAA